VHLHQPQRARLGITPYRNRTRPHLKFEVKGHYINGTRARRFFKTKAEAETFVQQLRIKSENLGTRAAQVDPKLHYMAVESSELLAPYGKSILDAAKFYQHHLEATARSCSVSELIVWLLQSKAADGKRDRYLNDLRARLARFQKDFGNRVVATITATECDDWLRAFRLSAQSRNNFRAVLSVLFSYAVTRGYCLENPITKTAKAKVIDKPVEVLTPEQMRRYLECASPKIQSGIAIGGFGGLRPIELDRLDWKEVMLDRDYIEITAANSKTASRRLVKILPNLKEWLEIAPNRTGPVLPPDYRTLVSEARISADLVEWPSNALRHSYASYHLAKFQDAASLALQMGHTTTKMLFAHYREVVTPEAATAYWNIRPLKPQGAFRIREDVASSA
jgi:integrase